MARLSYQQLSGKPSWISSTDSYGIVLLLLSALLYSVMGVFIKLAFNTGAVSSMQLVFFRAIIQGSVVMSAMSFWYTEETNPDLRLIQQPFGLSRSVRKVVIARGLVGAMGLVFHYYTVSSLPLGDATALLSLSPIITVMASLLLARDEPAGPCVVLAATASVAGSVLISRPSFLFSKVDEGMSGPQLGHMAGLMGSCCSAAGVMLVRQAGKTGVHTLQLLFSWCFFGTVYGATAIALLERENPFRPKSAKSVSYIILMSIFGMSAHFLLNYAGRFAPASLTAILRSSTILWAYSFEALVFDQIPVWSSLAGALLILMSVAVVTLCKQSKKRDDDAETQQLLLRTDDSELGLDMPTRAHE